MTRLIFLLCLASPQEEPKDAVTPALADLRVGTPLKYGRLTLFPIYGDAKELPVTTLDAALKAKWVELKETHTGRAARLEGQAKDHYIHIDNGLVFKGGGQDVTTGGGGTQPPKGNNGVGNGQDPQPPGNPPPNDGPGTGPGDPGNQGGPNGMWIGDVGTFCCEKGRSGGSKDFAAAEHLAPPRIRLLTVRGAQEEIWNTIAEMEKTLGAASATHSLDKLFRHAKVKGPSDQAVAAFTGGLAKARGVVCAIDGRIVGAELFAGPNHFKVSLPMVIKSYALETMATPPPTKRGAAPTQAEAREFLTAARNAMWSAGVARGAGQTYGNGDEYDGAITLVGGALVRAEIFAKPGKEKKTATRPGK